MDKYNTCSEDHFSSDNWKSTYTYTLTRGLGTQQIPSWHKVKPRGNGRPISGLKTWLNGSRKKEKRKYETRPRFTSTKFRTWPEREMTKDRIHIWQGRRTPREHTEGGRCMGGRNERDDKPMEGDRLRISWKFRYVPKTSLGKGVRSPDYVGCVGRRDTNEVGSYIERIPWTNE